MKSFKRFLFEAPQARLDYIKKTYGLDDKLTKQIGDVDPTPNGEYTNWLAVQVKRELVKLPEDTTKIKEQLTAFTKLKRSPRFHYPKDISRYTPSDLYRAVEDALGAGQISKKEQARDLMSWIKDTKPVGITVLVDQWPYWVFKVSGIRPTHIAAGAKLMQKLSSGTNWCTIEPSTAREYLCQGPTFMFYLNGKPYAQWHPQSAQIMDREDKTLVQTSYGVHHGTIPDKLKKLLELSKDKDEYLKQATQKMFNLKGEDIWSGEPLYGGKTTWLHGRLHSLNDEPSLVTDIGTKVWHKHGVTHRDGSKPAVTYPDGGAEWYQNGEWHREGDLPAIDIKSVKHWYKNGKRHREGGKPESVFNLGPHTIKKVWYDKNGQISKVEEWSKRKLIRTDFWENGRRIKTE